MILSTTKQLSPVDQGPNNIRRGIPCRTVKTGMIFWTESTSDLGLDVLSTRRILLLPMMALASGRELKSFPSGVLDVGFVYESKYLRKTSNSIRWALRKRPSFTFSR